MLKKDYIHLSMLLKRGCNVNKITCEGKTPLHYAIEANLESKMIKFLLNSDANPHIKDKTGQDCCDKVKGRERYKRIKFF